MRTEINVTNLTRANHAASAHQTPSAIDVANGATIALNNRGTAALIVLIRNTGNEAKSVTIPATARHLGAAFHLGMKPSFIRNVPPGKVCMIASPDGQQYASEGRIDFDFEAGFTGEIAAFWLP